MKKHFQASIVMVAVGIAGGAAYARSLQVAGTAGYLSEWEFNGSVSQNISTGGKEFFGPLIIKHVGVCSVNGPLEKQGEIRFRILKAGVNPRINATISFDGAQCHYSGEFSGGLSGHMDCPDAQGIPISISIK